jgi:chorismate mutase
VTVRGIRGAISVKSDSPEDIRSATQRLVTELLLQNAVEPADIASILFSLTPDLHAMFPALAVREMGLTNVPMLHCAEIDVPGSLPRCIRVLAHVNTDAPQDRVSHVYLDEAVALRPDLHSKTER